MSTAGYGKVCAVMCSVVILLIFHNDTKVRRMSNTVSQFKPIIDHKLFRICDENKERLSWKQREFRKSIRKHFWDFSNHLVFCPLPGMPDEIFRLFLNLLNVNTSLVESQFYQTNGARRKWFNVFKEIKNNLISNWNANILIKVSGV